MVAMLACTRGKGGLCNLRGSKENDRRIGALAWFVSCSKISTTYRSPERFSNPRDPLPLPIRSFLRCSELVRWNSVFSFSLSRNKLSKQFEVMLAHGVHCTIRDLEFRLFAKMFSTRRSLSPCRFPDVYRTPNQQEVNATIPMFPI